MPETRKPQKEKGTCTPIIKYLEGTKCDEEGNYSKFPCRQGNGLKIRKITFEVDNNIKNFYISEILNT